MRIRSLFLLSAVLGLLITLPVAAGDAMIEDAARENPATEASGQCAPAAQDAADVTSLQAPEGEATREAWSEPQPMASFGSHCSGPPSPWTCGHTGSGLGCPPGGQCTYSCQCDECVMSDGRVETVAINCTLVDDGGCLACPM